MRPILLVTCKPGNEEWCENEIGNILFRLDPELRIERTKYPALLIAYSRLDPLKAYTVLRSHDYGFVQNIIPVFLIADTFDKLITEIGRLVEGNMRIKLKLRIRGIRGRSRQYWAALKNALREIGVVHDPSSNICLFVEGIDGKFYAGVGDCRLHA